MAKAVLKDFEGFEEVKPSSVKKNDFSEFEEFTEPTLAQKIKEYGAGIPERILGGKFPEKFGGEGGFLDKQLLSGALPMAGTLAGGLIGSTAGPASAIGLSGLGAAGGRGFEDALRNIAGLPGGPKTNVEALKNLGSSAALGAGTEAGVRAVAAPLSYVYGHAKNLIQSSNFPIRLRSIKEKLIPGSRDIRLGKEADFLTQEARRKSEYNADIQNKMSSFKEQEVARKAAFEAEKEAKLLAHNVEQAKRKAVYQSEKELAKESIERLPEKLGVPYRGVSAKNFQNAVSLSERNLNNALDDAVTPIMSKFRNEKISVEPIRAKIVEFFAKEGLVDANGNIIKDRILNLPGSGIDATRKNILLKMSDLLEEVSKNPNVWELDQLRRSLQSAANFGSAARTAEQKVFGSLSREVKENLYDGIEKIASPEIANAVKVARSTWAENRKVFDVLNNIAEKNPENIVNGARNFFNETFLKDVMNLQPQLKPKIADVILNDIARSYKSPGAIKDVLDKYGRNTLKELLGESTFNTLISAEKRMIQASKPFQMAAGPNVGKLVPNKPPKFEAFVQNELPREQLPKYWSKVLDSIDKGKVYGKDVSVALINVMTNKYRNMKGEE